MNLTKQILYNLIIEELKKGAAYKTQNPRREKNQP